jgi:glucose-1-phosphate adenylyltransferase
MGIYVFNTDVLIKRLSEGTPDRPRIDFGKHVIPDMISEDKVYAYPFQGYWVDVGTIQSYWETNLALISPETAKVLNLHDPNWVIHTRSEERPPVKLGPQAQVESSLISNGCVIRGRVERSVLSPGVYVSPGLSMTPGLGRVQWSTGRLLTKTRWLAPALMSAMAMT